MGAKLYGMRISVLIPEAKSPNAARMFLALILKTGSEQSLVEYQITGQNKYIELPRQKEKGK